MREDVKQAIETVLHLDCDEYRADPWLRDYDRRLIEMHFFEGEASLRECARRLQHLVSGSRHETFAYRRMATILTRMRRELERRGYDDDAT